MKTDEQKTNNKEKVVNGNEKDAEHTISIEFSLEVTGEDEPTKYDKRRGRWAVVALWSLLALILSVLSFVFVDMNAYSFFAALISFAVCLLSFINANDIDPEEPTWPMPWYYGGL